MSFWLINFIKLYQEVILVSDEEFWEIHENFTQGPFSENVLEIGI